MKYRCHGDEQGLLFLQNGLQGFQDTGHHLGLHTQEDIVAGSGDVLGGGGGAAQGLGESLCLCHCAVAQKDFHLGFGGGDG